MPLTISLDYDHTDEIADAIERDIEQAIQDGAAEIAQTAQAIVPVDTGALRASITMRRGMNEWIVETRIEYAPFVEFGTRYMAAQPYLRPAYERHRPGIIAACEAAIRRHATGR